MDLTYTQVIQAAPELFGLVYAGLALFAGKHVVIQARNVFDVLRNWGKPLVDDKDDAAIKWISKTFNITPDQAINALKDVSKAEKNAGPVEAQPKAE
ncbi:MAG: hypothetical protein ACYTEQ_26180 [Planctomycetota bacterium]|jgi:hypothetical protein